MALALLELTLTAKGDVLRQLVVVTIEQAAMRTHLLPSGAVNRVRLFTLIDGSLPGVPSNVHAHLESAALSGLDQLARIHGTKAVDKLGPSVVLWRNGHLQDLQSHSLAWSLAEWLARPGRVDDDVVLEIVTAFTATRDITNSDLVALFSRLRDDLAASMRHRIVATPEADRATEESSSSARASISALSPGEKIVLEAAIVRESLAEQWPSAAQVNAKLDPGSRSGKCRASQWRRDGRLLGVYVTSPAPSYRYPTWQFHLDGHVVDQVAEILSVLRDSGLFEQEPEGLHRTTGWGEVEWFLSPHVLLDGDPPAVVLATEPARVLRAAHEEFEGGAGWLSR